MAVRTGEFFLYVLDAAIVAERTPFFKGAFILRLDTCIRVLVRTLESLPLGSRDDLGPARVERTFGVGCYSLPHKFSALDFGLRVVSPDVPPTALWQAPCWGAHVYAI